MEECHSKGVEYSAGANELTVLGSVEAQLIADDIKGGLGLNQAMRLVNTHRG